MEFLPSREQQRILAKARNPAPETAVPRAAHRDESNVLSHQQPAQRAGLPNAGIGVRDDGVRGITSCAMPAAKA